METGIIINKGVITIKVKEIREKMDKGLKTIEEDLQTKLKQVGADIWVGPTPKDPWQYYFVQFHGNWKFSIRKVSYGVKFLTNGQITKGLLKGSKKEREAIAAVLKKIN